MNKLTRNLLILGLALAVWGISFFFSGDNTSQPDDSTKEICHAQLDEIQRAKQKWAADNKQTFDARPTELDLLSYFPKKKMPECPGGGKYMIDTVTNPPRCSIETHIYP
jgi:hypothetical protein